MSLKWPLVPKSDVKHHSTTTYYYYHLTNVAREHPVNMINTTYLYNILHNVGPASCWSNIVQMLYNCFVFTGYSVLFKYVAHTTLCLLGTIWSWLYRWYPNETYINTWHKLNGGHKTKLGQRNLFVRHNDIIRAPLTIAVFLSVTTCITRWPCRRLWRASSRNLWWKGCSALHPVRKLTGRTTTIIRSSMPVCRLVRCLLMLGLTVPCRLLQLCPDALWQLQ